MRNVYARFVAPLNESMSWIHLLDTIMTHPLKLMEKFGY